MQGVEARVRVLVDAIKTCFSSNCLAVIIDDVWNLEQLDKLGLTLDCKSSLMVTSIQRLPDTYVAYVRYNISREDNSAQEEAILASYVAADPEIETVHPDLKVHLQCMHCCHHGQTMLPYTERGYAEFSWLGTFGLHCKADGRGLGCCLGVNEILADDLFPSITLHKLASATNHAGFQDIFSAYVVAGSCWSTAAEDWR
jgi:hypothetical protein